jgi:hypothetical protein
MTRKSDVRNRDSEKKGHRKPQEIPVRIAPTEKFRLAEPAPESLEKAGRSSGNRQTTPERRLRES